jgi:HEPN domain-containing protein
MPPETPDSTDPQEWMRRVRSNLARARDASGVPHVLYEDLCFDAQQAAEKAIKAVLVKAGKPYPKTHVIERLLALAEEAGAEVGPEIREAAILSDYATIARYPGPGEHVTAEEHSRAVELAEKVVRWAESQLAD